MPDPDDVIGVTSKEGGTISRPGEGKASWGLGGHLLGAGAIEVSVSLVAELSNKGLDLKIPDLDAMLSGSAKPVLVGAEDKCVDDSVGSKGIKMLTIIEVPEHGGTVLSSGSAEGSIRGDGDGVNVARVVDQVCLDLAVGKVPDLDHLIPTTGNDHGIIRGEPNAADPLLVSSIVDGELALTKSVPQLDGLVTGSRDNLSVISRESNAENILGVSNEPTCGGSGGNIPKAEGVIPGSRECELSVRGNHDVLDEVVVSVKGTLGEATALSVLLLAVELPDNDSLVTRSRNDHVGFASSSGDGGNPSRMTLKTTAQDNSF